MAGTGLSLPWPSPSWAVSLAGPAWLLIHCLAGSQPPAVNSGGPDLDTSDGPACLWGCVWRAPSRLWGPALRGSSLLPGHPEVQDWWCVLPQWAPWSSSVTVGPGGGCCHLLPTKRAPPVLLPTETHPRPPKPDPVKSVSGVLGGLTPAKSAPVINNGSPTILGKRSYEQHNGVDGESLLGRPGGASGPGVPSPAPASPTPADRVLSPLSPAAGRWQAT